MKKILGKNLAQLKALQMNLIKKKYFSNKQPGSLKQIMFLFGLMYWKITVIVVLCVECHKYGNMCSACHAKHCA